jgi:hypothetical protein
LKKVYTRTPLNTAMPLLPPMCTILSWIRWSIPAPAANGSDRRINTGTPAHKPIVEPWKVIAEPAGFLIAPRGWERVSDVSNVVFTNGAIADDDGKVYIYYAASDTRLHVASTTIGQLLDFAFKTPADPLRSCDCVAQRVALIEKNQAYLNQQDR